MLNNDRPLYTQIEDELKFKIDSGEWTIGDKIPSEHSLEEQYKVSRITVRRALTSLTEAGYLERHRGRGTFVKSVSRDSGKESFTIAKSYTKEMIELGRKPATMWAHVTEVEATPEMAERLHVQVGLPLLHLERLRGADNEVITFADTYTPMLQQYTLNDDDYLGSLYEYLATLGIRLTDQAEYVEAVSSTPELEQILRMKESGPLLKRVRQISDHRTGYVEYSVNYYIASRYRYYVAF